MKTPPDIIYLQCYDEDGTLFSELHDAYTWCSDKINDLDVEYIKKSLYDELVHENGNLKQKVELLEGVMKIVRGEGN